jgi:putative oxidoreductase
MEQTRTIVILSWTLRIVAAAILVQTLFFKFSGAPESVYIFSQLGAEPWGRIGSGVIELIASALLLIPRTTVYGAAIAVLVMGGAVMSHITTLGITMPAVGDHGQLFALACLVALASAVVLYLHRQELPIVGR